MKLFDGGAAGPGDEGFTALFLGFVGGQDFCGEGVEFGGADAAEEFAGNALLVVQAAAEDEVVAVGAVEEFGADEAEIAAVVLRAGVGAAGEVDVHGRSEGGVLAEVLQEREGVGLGVGGGELAAAAAGAGDDAAGGEGGFVEAARRTTERLTVETKASATWGG